ncbi:hypothetical protein vBRpoPV13_03 [Ruegeria phage vB_RpoP-V13]|jgi:hypothetical protein|uniref:Uncharacterized protein n=1 Tax=Ruegeria phage vB_RpoP-V13 TaxID=2218612 RepID=A0A2Z4QGF6_9CAUD|nr:hypothetical protein HYP63_gp03 [Ruegeria phage vB_RpoP-V13]AWY09360.1 hypothetical protein vBRpoPV13_03 [Ruegeria phage vB_RpoP-V13]
MNQVADDRQDHKLEIEGVTYRASYLRTVQKIVYTAMDGSTAGTVNILRPFASKTPAAFLIRNEVLNHIDHMKQDHRAEKWPEVYC